MLKSLQNISHPLLRAITAGLTASAIATMLSAIVIGFSAPKNEDAHRLGVYLSLLSAVGGGAVGLGVGGKKRSAPQPSEAVWQDWRNFVVMRKVKESEEITSFYLQPQDGKPLPDFKPRQFLTIKLDIPGQSRAVIRTYSLSDYQASGEYYRLSIKREGSPEGLDVPPGVASNFMHDRVEVGKIIPAKPPNGKFYLDLNASYPIILISNGVGITPMIAMAKATTLNNPQRPVWFLHGARNGNYHAFRAEMADLVRSNPHLSVHYRYSRPLPEEEATYPSRGYVDMEMIRTVVAPELERLNALAQAQYFLCGSPSFMDSLLEGLRAWGVDEQRIHTEAFGGKVGKTVTSDSGAETAEIVFSRSQKTLTWTPDGGTILEFAEAQGIDPPYSCRAGICLTCMCRLEEGEIEYQESPTGTPDAGSVLICISKPKTAKVVLDL
jgi:ferredoxin-NADP reductase